MDRILSLGRVPVLLENSRELWGNSGYSNSTGRFLCLWMQLVEENYCV